MPTQLFLPELAEPATEFTVERYFTAVGAVVERGRPFVVVASDHYEWEIPATLGGTVTEILALPGASVQVGAPLLKLRTDDGVIKEPAAPRATPVARRIADMHGLDLREIAGTRRSDRVTRDDVLRVIEATRAPCAVPAITRRPAPSSSSHLPLAAKDADLPGTARAQPSGSVSHCRSTPQQLFTRSAHAEHLPHIHPPIPLALTAAEVDLTAVLAHIEHHAARFARHSLRLDQVACIAYAAVKTLRNHRFLNSTWTDGGIVLWHRINLGIERTSEDGSARVIDDADALNLRGLARALTGTATPPSATTRPTFTVSTALHSSWGTTDSMHHECPLLHIGAVEQRPHVIEQNQLDLIAVRPLTILTLTYDARIVSQLQADAFLVSLKQRLEHFTAL